VKQEEEEKESTTEKKVVADEVVEAPVEAVPLNKEEPAAPKEPHRLDVDFEDIQKTPIEDCKIISNFDGCQKEILFLFKGPSHTPYHKGIYKVSLQFTPQFPQVPPVCIFKTKIYHPQVREDGFGRFWIEVAQNVTVRKLI
jgi:hypothetical protein